MTQSADQPGTQQKVQLLLSALFLGEEGRARGIMRRIPGEWVAEWLGLEPEHHFGPNALRHLVAVQLAPRAAIAYDAADPIPRWKLIDAHIAARFRIEDDERELIARRVARVLDQAARGRGRPLLDPSATSQCALCRLPFQSMPPSVSTKDPYKPTWQSPEELCKPEVDHVVAIAGLGVHEASNLQVVCRACNLAKGSGLIVDPDIEIRYAGAEPSDAPRIHLFRLLQWLIVRSDGRCACGSQDAELTMRGQQPDAALTRANLRLMCYACLPSSPDGGT